MRRASLAIATSVLAALTLGPAAHAAFEPLGSGTTTLVLDKGFASFLRENGIELMTADGAKRRGRSYLLPVFSGQIDPTTGKGEANSKGALLFRGRRKQVPLRQITVKAKHEPLLAKVGGSQLKVASAAKIGSSREGFGTLFQAKALKLTAKAITRLNKKLRPKSPFRAGQALGSLSADVQPQLMSVLDQGKATIAFDPVFLQKLDSRFVSLNPIFPAEHLGGTFTFPVVAGGAVAPDGSEGTLRTGGALEFLQLGAGQVFWSELWLDLGAHSDSAELDLEPAPAFPGKVGRSGVLDLGAAAFSADPKARTLSTNGAPLTLSAAAAQSFDEAFAQGGPAVFFAGETVGSVSFTAQGQ